MSGIPREPTPILYARPLRRYFAATRPAFLSVTFFAVMIGLATASTGGKVDLLRAVVTLVFALCAHAGVNVLNDYYDALNGSDAANTERLYPYTGGSRFIQNGVLSLRATRWFGYTLMAAVIPAGLWLSLVSAPALLGIGLAGLLIGWAYSAPPLQLMCRGLGELAIAAGWWLVVVGSDFVQRGSFAPLPMIAAVSYALLVVNILYINQFPDRRADASAGKRTLVVRLGPRKARWGYVAIAVLAHAWLYGAIRADWLPLLSALALVSSVPAYMAAGTLLRHARHPARFRSAISASILAANLHGLLLAVTIALL